MNGEQRRRNEMTEEIEEYDLTEEKKPKNMELMFRHINPVTGIRFEIRTNDDYVAFVLNTGKDMIVTTMLKLLAKVTFWSAYNDGRTKCNLNTDPLNIVIEERTNMVMWKFTHSLANLPPKALFFTPKTTDCSLHGLHLLMGGHDDDLH